MELTLKEVLKLQPWSESDVKQIKIAWPKMLGLKAKKLTLYEVSKLELDTQILFNIILDPDLLGLDLYYSIACDSVEHALHYFENLYPKEKSLRETLNVVRQFARGEASEAELDLAQNKADKVFKVANYMAEYLLAGLNESENSVDRGQRLQEVKATVHASGVALACFLVANPPEMRCAAPALLGIESINKQQGVWFQGEMRTPIQIWQIKQIQKYLKSETKLLPEHKVQCCVVSRNGESTKGSNKFTD